MFKSSKNIREKEIHKKRRGYEIEIANDEKRKWRGKDSERGWKAVATFRRKEAAGQDETGAVRGAVGTGQAPSGAGSLFVLPAVSPACPTCRPMWASQTAPTSPCGTP